MKKSGKYIIKNIEKFKNISLRPCISLDNCNKIFRYGDEKINPSIGASTGLYGKYWFIVNGQKAIFKTFETAPLNSLLRITNELVCQELARQIDLPCAKYELAELKGHNGLISYNVAKENESLMSGVDLCQFFSMNPKNNIANYQKVLKLGKLCNYKINVSQEILNLYKLCIFDYLTFQGDRHMNNLFFLYNKDNQSIKLSPIIDNEMAFCCLDIYAELLGENQSATLDNILESFNDSQMLSIYPIKDLTNKHKDVEQQIIHFAKKYTVAMNVLKSVLKNIDIIDAVEKAESHNIKISNEYKKYIITLFEYNKNRLQKCLENEMCDLQI